MKKIRKFFNKEATYNPARFFRTPKHTFAASTDSCTKSTYSLLCSIPLYVIFNNRFNKSNFKTTSSIASLSANDFVEESYDDEPAYNSFELYGNWSFTFFVIKERDDIYTMYKNVHYYFHNNRIYTNGIIVSDYIVHPTVIENIDDYIGTTNIKTLPFGIFSKEIIGLIEPIKIRNSLNSNYIDPFNTITHFSGSHSLELEGHNIPLKFGRME